jgi:hypothetical protein
MRWAESVQESWKWSKPKRNIIYAEQNHESKNGDIGVFRTDYGAFGIHDLYIVHREDGDPDAAVVVDHWEIDK